MGKGDKKTEHGYGAFAKDDCDDAKRGEPSGTLEAYAASRGLTFTWQSQLGAYRGILPAFPEYIFNVMTGVLPGGAVGALQHELQEVELDQSRGIMWGGEFHGTHYTVKGKGFWNTVLPVEIFDKAPPNEPFAANALWAPVTAGVARVSPLLPRELIRRKERVAAGNPELSEWGAPGYRMEGWKLPPEVMQAIVGGEVGEVLRTLPHPHVELMLDHGGVALRRNGFVMDDDRLDDLAHALSRVVEGLRTAVEPWLRPQPLTATLPPPGAEPPTEFPWYEWAWGPWVDMYDQAAKELGLTREDPVEYHRAFPAQPIPGAAHGVLRGALPGWDGVDGRLVFTTHGRGTNNTVRAGVVIAAPAGAPTFPPGGQKLDETDQYVEVVDGIAAIWNRVRTAGELQAAPTLERALTTARQVGLV
ncbi:MAG: hypothetical protein U0W40_17300 [Acidimicrobiia bacterium]